MRIVFFKRDESEFFRKKRFCIAFLTIDFLSLTFKESRRDVADRELQRGLQNRHIGLIALGGIIGSSYFLGTGYLLHAVGPCAFLAYALGGLISYLTLSCLAELSVSCPSQGSFVHSAAVYISSPWACGVGWSYWFSWVIYIPSECIGGAMIMHTFVPEVSPHLWALLFGVLVTLCNIAPVKAFGEAEFWLALIKVTLLIGFCVMAVAIFMGWGGDSGHSYVGGKNLWGNGGLFPNGISVLFVNMVVLMANFQGSEIIGLTASEAKHPKTAVPRALKKVSWRIIGLYIIPTFLLVLVLPWQEASLSENAFSAALDKYGHTTFAKIFSFVIVAGAISSANGGLYATIRTLFSLGQRKMGPKILTKVTRQGVPIYASLITLAVIWALLLLSLFTPSGPLYANLLAISGFTGSICWISICWSQLCFRRHFKEVGAKLTYRVPFFPYITHFAIWLQVGTLVVVLLTPELRSSFYFGVPAFLIPLLWYKKYRGNKMIPGN